MDGIYLSRGFVFLIVRGVVLGSRSDKQLVLGVILVVDPGTARGEDDGSGRVGVGGGGVLSVREGDDLVRSVFVTGSGRGRMRSLF